MPATTTTAASTTKPVLSYSAPRSLRWQREACADGSVRLIVSPRSWRSEIKLAAVIALMLDCIPFALIIMNSTPGLRQSFRLRGILLAMSTVVLMSIFLLIPLQLLVAAMFERRVITVTVTPDRVVATWRRRLWTREMSWPREPIARVDAKALWGNVTARDRAGKKLFTVSPPDSQDVLWLAENLRRELGLADAVS